jgi:hypothetical protein
MAAASKSCQQPASKACQQLVKLVLFRSPPGLIRTDTPFFSALASKACQQLVTLVLLRSPPGLIRTDTPFFSALLARSEMKRCNEISCWLCSKACQQLAKFASKEMKRCNEISCWLCARRSSCQCDYVRPYDTHTLLKRQQGCALAAVYIYTYIYIYKYIDR